MPALIGEDFKIRGLVRSHFRQAAISWVGIERAGAYLRVNIHTGRPGVVIGKKGVDIENIKSKIETLTNRKTFVNVVEIREPELDARLVAEAIAAQLEKRAAYRRTLKRTMERTMQSGALGIKIQVSGRLNGGEIARREWMREGRVPLHTFCADIDYGLIEAHTMAGLIGVKVWIFKKEHFVKSHKELLTMAKKAIETPGGSMPAVSRGPRRGGRARGRPTGRREGRPDMLMPKRVKYRKTHSHPRSRDGQEGNPDRVRRVRLEGARAAVGDGAADRGRSRGHRTQAQEGRQALGEDLPGQGRDEASGRDPHGQGQGSPGPLGRRGQARARPFRDTGRVADRGPGRARRRCLQAPHQDQIRRPGDDIKAKDWEAKRHMSVPELHVEVRQTVDKLVRLRVKQRVPKGKHPPALRTLRRVARLRPHRRTRRRDA